MNTSLSIAEVEPVLDEAGFRTLLLAAGVPSVGVGLPTSSIVSIFDMCANSVTNLMTYSHFARSLELIAARTAVPPGELKVFIAESPVATQPRTPRTPARAGADITVAEEEAEAAHAAVHEELGSIFGAAAAQIIAPSSEDGDGSSAGEVASVDSLESEAEEGSVVEDEGVQMVNSTAIPTY